MALAANPMIPNDGVVSLTDATPTTPITTSVQYEDGDFQVTGLRKSQKAVQVFKSRGRTYAIRETEDQEIDFSFSCHAIALVGDGTLALPSDAILRRTGTPWATAISTLPLSAGDAYCLLVGFRAERTNFSATADAYVGLKYCSISMDFQEGIPGKLSFKGTAYIISTDYISFTPPA